MIKNQGMKRNYSKKLKRKYNEAKEATRKCPYCRKIHGEEGWQECLERIMKENGTKKQTE